MPHGMETSQPDMTKRREIKGFSEGPLQSAGGRYCAYAETAVQGPEWGGQLSFNFLFPD